MSRLDVKQQEQDSFWQDDIPQPSNGGGVQQDEFVKKEGVEQSGVEQSGVEQSEVEQSGAGWSEQECISIAISAESARVGNVKANWNVNG